MDDRSDNSPLLVPLFTFVPGLAGPKKSSVAMINRWTAEKNAQDRLRGERDKKNIFIL
jgi:hypothetical protein